MNFQHILDFKLRKKFILQGCKKKILSWILEIKF